MPALVATRPIPTSGVAKRARSVPIRRSQLAANSSAPPMQTPSIAASTGTGAANVTRVRRWKAAIVAAQSPALAASCDLRLATDRARFGTPEVGIGLTYTNAGSHFLPAAMGETAARELLLTGALRDVEWAQRHRFVCEVVVSASELDGRVAAWAAKFDGVSRAAVARTKAMLNDRFGDLLEAAMEREERACIDLFEGPDAPAALQAFAQRR